MAEAATDSSRWDRRLQQRLGLLGHRNWIGVVDAAYPLQTSPGIEMIDTGAPATAVIQAVLAILGTALHVRPIAYTDFELGFVAEEDAVGVTAYRWDLEQLLAGVTRHRWLHEQIIARLSEAGKEFNILLLKTTLVIPYTSVFFELECGYWPAAAEVKLRAAMESGPDASHEGNSPPSSAENAGKAL